LKVNKECTSGGFVLDAQARTINRQNRFLGYKALALKYDFLNLIAYINRN